MTARVIHTGAGNGNGGHYHHQSIESQLPWSDIKHATFQHWCYRQLDKSDAVDVELSGEHADTTYKKALLVTDVVDMSTQALRCLYDGTYVISRHSELAIAQ